jgi:stage V sporulation protein SpoVS
MSNILNDIFVQIGDEMEEAPRIETFKKKDEDPGFLVAKGRFSGVTLEEKQNKEKDHRSKLANAIYMAMRNHGYATIRSIGTNAIANAVRSITMATERCHNRGVSLAWESVVETGNLGHIRSEDHVQDVTAYCFKITAWTDMEKNNDSDSRPVRK